MDSYDQLNDVLVRVFNHALKIEENSLIREEFKEISMNDMHILDAIGDENTSGTILYRIKQLESSGG